MGTRKRIIRPTIGKGPDNKTDNANNEGTELVEDKLVYRHNKASQNAKLTESIHHRIILDLWHDKHYALRHSVGDDNGARQGIEPDVVRQLVTWAMKHLLYYSATVKEFNFLNHENPNPRREYNRILLQDTYSDDLILNVPVEVHFIDFFRYEITVISAMRVNNFDTFDGQYILELGGEYDSRLTRWVRKQRVPIGECTT